MLLTGHDAPRYGNWISPAGAHVRNVLSDRGPLGLDVEFWWDQAPEHSGRRLTDFLCETGGLGLKLLSARMVEVLSRHGAALEIFEPDIRMRDGVRVEGFLAVLEETGMPGPVHSAWRGRRGDLLVVSDEVRAALEAAELTGLLVEPAPGPFPGDTPGFFDD